ncbi:hypothetical protein V6N13_038944 [Hibiscus sabdariffa]
MLISCSNEQNLKLVMFSSVVLGSFMFHFSRSANVLKSESIPRLRHGPYRSALKMRNGHVHRGRSNSKPGRKPNTFLIYRCA